MNAATPFPWPGESAERGLSALFGHAPVGIARCSHQGVITAVNPALEELLGHRIPPPSRLEDLLGYEDGGESERLFRELIEGERSSFQLERGIPGDPVGAGSVKWTTWRVDGFDGEPPYGLVMAEDVKSNRRSERRLRQAQKFEAVGRMAGGIAHDFNNLVTGVLLYSDLLLAEMDAGTRLQGYAEEIRAAGMRAADVVRQLLVAARPQESSPPALSLNTVIEGMRDLLARLVGTRGSLNFNLDPNLGSIRMLPSQAQQILLNLVLNSRDALAEGGRIAIETTNCRVQIVADNSGEAPDEAGSIEPRMTEPVSATLPCAVFSVSDNGIGMDAETQEHLFEAFFTTKTPDKGTGLGLATVHDLVSTSGGLIYVDSAPGRGTRVTILLPLFPEAATPCRTQSGESVGHEGATLQPEKEIIS